MEANQDPLKDSVAIPAEELADRRHELPRPDKPLEVYGSPSPILADRAYDLTENPIRGPKGRCRLWDYNPLLDRIGPPGRALDLGCGAGRDAIALACLGWQITACDNLASSIERARQMEAIYSDGALIDWRIVDLRKEIPTKQRDAPPGFELVTAFFFWKEEAILHATNELKPGGLLAIEMFTPTDQALHGKPKHVVDKAGLQKLFPTYEPMHLEEQWENDRHTVRAILKKPE
jgi:SAM-dependent methyltransferase